MRSYMYAYGYNNLAQAQLTLEESGASADACGDCTQCAVKCTEGFDVRQRIQDVATLKEVPPDFLV